MTAGVKLEQFGPLDVAALQACHGLTEAGRPVDHPRLPAVTFEGFRNWWFHGDDPQQSWLGRDDSGEAVGCYQLILPERENRVTAFGGLFVAPARRRVRVGTALLAHCVAQARQAGRVRLASTGATRTKIRENSAGATFAAAVGASIGLAEMIRIQEITADLIERLAVARAEAERYAVTYELLSWAGLRHAARKHGCRSGVVRNGDHWSLMYDPQADF